MSSFVLEVRLNTEPNADKHDHTIDCVTTLVFCDASADLVPVIAECLVKIGKHHPAFSMAVNVSAAKQLVCDQLAVFVDDYYVAVPAQIKFGDLAPGTKVMVTRFNTDKFPWQANTV
jgi:hypothetical protein